MSLLDLRSLLEESGAVTGTVGVDYLYDDVTGELLVDDETGEPLTSEDPNLGAMTWTFSTASAGSALSGSGGVAFTFSELASGLETITGTGAVSFGYTNASSGQETETGALAETYGFSINASGAETFISSGGVTFGFSEAASGSQSTNATGTGAVVFGFALASEGSGGASLGGHVAKGPRYIIRRAAERPEPILVVVSGGLEVAFGFDIAASGNTNDDDLVIALAA